MIYCPEKTQTYAGEDYGKSTNDMMRKKARSGFYETIDVTYNNTSMVIIAIIR